MNLFNLLGAILLTVSPILNEPKNVTRPDNVIMEKVEYLPNNIIATSYIYEDLNNTSYNYHLNLNDGKDINLDYVIYSYKNYPTRDLYFMFGGGEAVSTYEFSSYDELSTYGNLSSSDYYFNLSKYGELDRIVCAYTYEDYQDLDVVTEMNDLYVEISSEYSNYYENLDLNFDFDLSYDNLFTYYMSKYFFLKESAPITDNIFDVVGGTVEEYLNVVVDLFNEVVELFYVDNKLTILGVLLVFTFGIGIVKFGFNLIKSLLRL